MRKIINGYTSEELTEKSFTVGDNIEIVGLYKDTTIFSETVGILLPVYTYKGEYLIEEFWGSNFMGDLKSIEEMADHFLDSWPDTKDLDNYLDRTSPFRRCSNYEEYTCYFRVKKVGLLFEILEYPEDLLIKQAPLVVDEKTYIIAIKLPNNYIVLGDLDFIEKTITENVDDLEVRYDLLLTLYTNYRDYHRRVELINYISDNNYDELDAEFQQKNAKDREMSDLLNYAITIIETERKNLTDKTLKYTL